MKQLKLIIILALFSLGVQAQTVSGTNILIGDAATAATNKITIRGKEYIRVMSNGVATDSVLVIHNYEVKKIAKSDLNTGYLPLSAGSGNPLTGDLYFPSAGSLFTTSSKRMLNWDSDNNIFFGDIDNGFPGGLIFRTAGVDRYTIGVSGNNTWTGSGTFSGDVTALSFTKTGGTVNDVLLGNGTTTTKLGLPINTATQTALNLKEDAFSKNTAFNKNFGSTSGTVTEGNDSRVTNGQTAFGWGNHASAGYTTASNSQTLTNKSGNISQWTNDVGFITGLSFSGLTGKPTTLSGYGITDALPLSGGSLTGNLFLNSKLLLGTTATTAIGNGDIGLDNAGVRTGAIRGRNAADNAYITMMYVDGSDAVQVGGASTGIVKANSLMLNLTPGRVPYFGTAGLVQDDSDLTFDGTNLSVANGSSSGHAVNKGQLDLKAPLASPALTGVPTAPTAASGTNTTQIATTAFVQDALGSVAISSGRYTPTLTPITGISGTPTPSNFHYMRIGDEVHVTGYIEATTYTGGSCAIQFSLPPGFGSVFSSDDDVAGTVTSNNANASEMDVYTIGTDTTAYIAFTDNVSSDTGKYSVSFIYTIYIP